MSRPADWEPLAARDPIGGDVGTVSDEARYYAQLASEISDQVARLHRIAAESDQVGKTADKLRNAAADTAGTLQKTHGRVAAVAEALTSWIPSLEQAQQDSLTALDRARDAAARQHANTPAPGSPAPTTDAEKAADAARADRLDQAGIDLAAAHSMLSDVVATRNRAAQRIADEIHGALHDGLNDGFWDHVSNWVAEHVEAIKIITEVLSWVATAIAVIALFIPGVNLLVIAAWGVMALAFAGHALLASTGNGSWTDVVLDVVGMLTFRVGTVAGKAAAATREAMLARAGDIEASRASNAVLASRGALREALGNQTAGFLGKVLHPITSLKLAGGFFDAASGRLARSAGETARAAVMDRALPRVGALDGVLNAGKDMAQLSADVSDLSRVYSGDRTVNALANTFAAQRAGFRAVGFTGQGLDWGNHLASRSDIPGLQEVLRGVPAWNRFKVSTTHAIFGAPAQGEG